MSFVAEPTLYKVECVILALTVVSCCLGLLITRLRRSRRDLSIGTPLAAGFGLRVAAIGGVSLTGVAPTLRGGDEVSFLALGQEISEAGLFSETSLDALTSRFHIWLLSVQLRIPDFPEFALRVGQVGIAMVGLALMAAAVYQLAGARAAKLAAWILAFEPASIFFSSVLHKESPMMLAGGLVAFGGAKLWSRRGFSGLGPMIGGCAVAVTTRPYAGWFLVAGAAAVILHASLTRRGEQQARALAMATVVALLVALALPTVLEQSSDENLQTNLQVSQEANVSDDANLSLERVDFTTRENILIHLPQRIRDVLLRPYPWQMENTSQRFGVLGTVVSLVLMFLLAQLIAQRPGDLLSRAAPLVYPMLFLFIAYALSAGNAGTSFRYRTHLVLFGICIVVVLREGLLARTTVAPRARRAEPTPALPGGTQPAT